MNADRWQFHTSILMSNLKAGTSTEMDIGQWHKIELALKKNGKNEAEFTEVIDGKVTGNWKAQPAEYHNVKWYQSDPWHYSVGHHITLQNFTIDTT